ncbi:hypothetical protein GN244_ATG18118 [Phytophthora infestans]|uniref:Uncharacterized protein n=1 Tax=Phytophthora infestans TaxID=4787 RepID=A0A833W504_PHYIN|nr:hypothetical protein GN244_ATG18118 [Phytophthora infestans]
MLSEKAVVFLDGYGKTRDECVVLWPCQKWRQQNKEHHRLVVVCSMVSMGKDYRPETWKTIPFQRQQQFEELVDFCLQVHVC